MRDFNFVKRILIGCTCVSAILFLLFASLYVFAWVADPSLGDDTVYFSLGGNIHVTVTKLWGGMVVFCQQPPAKPEA